MSLELKAAYHELRRQRRLVSASRHLIAIEERRIKQSLVVIGEMRSRIRAFAPHGDTEEICRGIR